MRSRAAAFAGLVALAVVVGGGYVTYAAIRGDDGPAIVRSGGLRLESGVLFQNVARTDTHSRLQVGSVVAGSRVTARRLTPLACERVHAGGPAASRVGICLQSRITPVGSGFRAVVFDRDFAEIERFNLAGVNSRARVSPDGRYAATTGFVIGHSYASDSFSTSTVLLDLRARKPIGNLERFTVRKDGRPLSSPDFNFWGVTFARDSDRFYATLGTRSTTYLVEGSVRGRSMRVLREGVECPSLSPDETRIAFKKRWGETGWRLHVLRLDDLSDWPLAERLSVDDQAEWLDEETVLYGLKWNVWAVPANGRGSPQIFISDALSPSVLRS